MILQALANYYAYLCEERPGTVPRPGWCERQVVARLVLDHDGHLVNIIPAEEKRGWTLTVPEQEKKSSGIASNLLCENSTYIFGIDNKGKPDRAVLCFEDARRRHLGFLSNVESPAAIAVRRYFETWDPVVERDNELLVRYGERIFGGGNLVFSVDGKDVLDDEAIQAHVDEGYAQPHEDDVVMRCLVSGEIEPIARLHPAIKGIMGAQATGASLVSFNAPAFESFGRDKGQGLNSPVGIASAFAYTTALNYLVGQPSHRIRLGDTTIVYWATKHDEECSESFSELVGGNFFNDEGDGGSGNEDKRLDAIMQGIRKGILPSDVEFDTPFYILGLAPNAGRLAVRFFLASTFGDVVTNLSIHYERLSICHAPFEREYLTPYWLLRETENPKAKHKAATSMLGGSLMRAILTNGRYPETLYTNTLLRIHTTQNNEGAHERKVTWGRAAIIKAYLIRNCNKSEQEVTVSLNEETRVPAYLLGRIFSILEAVQETANPGVNANIVDKYFDSASTTPAVVFPVIIKLANHHLSKIERDRPGLAISFRKQLGSLLGELRMFPKRLSIEEQGEFILGYYQQTQHRYEKKDQEVQS